MTPAAESRSPKRINEKIAVITGQRLCMSETDLSEMPVSARFCIR